MSRGRSTKAPAWLRAIHEKNQMRLLEHVRSAGEERGLLTSHAQLSEEIGLSPAAISAGLRKLRSDGKLEIVGERGNPVILIRTLERAS